MRIEHLDIKSKIAKKFGEVSELSSGIFQGLRRRNGRPFAAYVFDSSNRALDASIAIDDYLDDVIGRSYFDENSPPDLRWNHYLYFIVDDDEFQRPSFAETRKTLEENRNYARKFVVSAADFEQVVENIDAVASETSESPPLVDIVQIWMEKLNAAELSEVGDHDRPVADVVRAIATGKPKNTLRIIKRSGEGDASKLASEWIRQIDASGFRPHPTSGSFQELGRANLLFGANGAGKTSLLEAIEFLYCGANRRSKHYGRQKVLATLSDGSILTTTDNLPISDFRTRHEVWYGMRDASTKNSLPSQFGRFNFLNTDAAAELSLRSDTTTGNFDSLSQLLSGGDASNLWKRIQGVRKASNEAYNDVSGETERLRADLKIKDSQIEAMRQMPGEADVELRVLNNHLAKIGWKLGEANSIDNVRKWETTLTEAATRLAVLNQLHWLPKITYQDIYSQIQLLTQKCDEIEKARQTLINAERRIAQIEERLQLLNTRQAELRSISADEVANLVMLTQEHESLSRRIRIDSSIVEVMGDFPESADSTYLENEQISVSALRVTLAKETEQNSRDAIRAQNALTALEIHRNKQETLIAQIKDIANRALEHADHESRCPVCHTDFGSLEALRSRIEEDWLNPSSNEESLKLRTELENLSVQSVLLSRRVLLLSALARVCEISGKSPAATIPREALQKYAATRLSLQRLRSEYRDIEQKIRSSEAAGIDLRRVELLCNVGTGSVDERSKYDVRLAIARNEGEVQKALEELKGTLEDNRQLEETLAKYLALVAIPPDTAIDDAIETIRARESAAKRAETTLRWTEDFIAIDQHVELAQLPGAIDAALLSTRKYVAAYELENSAATELSMLHGRRMDLANKLEERSIRKARLKSAVEVLDGIITSLSLEAATKVLVNSTCAVASSIFAKIHAPNEYDITGDAAAPLRRHGQPNSKVQLNEVSTGQRAAYALSMFLAMNSRVESGPKVLLFDDPISHIDDMNALAFLDYLRDLVLSTNHQIFFATADEKIAGLFAHKFGFLDEEFKMLNISR